MIRLIRLLLLAAFVGPAMADSVHTSDGDLFIVAEDGGFRQLTTTHDVRDPVLSGDGKAVAFVRDPAVATLGGDGEVPDASEVWIMDAIGGEPRLLVANQPSETPEANLTAFNGLAFTSDGKALYFLAAAWVTSDALHRVDLADGKRHYLTGANSVEVLASGKYAVHLVITKHQYYPGGGSHEPYWLVTPEGKGVKELGDSEAEVEAFLSDPGVK